ncbi:hypothetical protein CANTEDRAFT_112418 [Yamadazyma tenuis ATCC 10573]|uniref:Uncharacterized protein n=1 Tax=Candida tenuis (strain ATCC 10573 / BCRC 21748 / CBS 615 / JCM 9827 / NBRC 10315 / NRRL Y-1498 / VKM Y-70) TaxID=590646 RepID=G3AX32_CANTC|nr:uncharacterized protein CANTEDRAFT_112418 [Yamadazyma tenuis ATCC 10573]EGV66677.1 hypothetical protein CANTEDRAFT_112418 [Yamadazyma tenuis ATCC 10573]
MSRHSVDSLFSNCAGPLASPASSHFDITSHEKPNTNSLKIHMTSASRATAIRLRKDKLKGLADLVKVVEAKFCSFNHLYLDFANKDLKPMAVDMFLQDIIMEYISAKDRIYIRVE